MEGRRVVEFRANEKFVDRAIVGAEENAALFLGTTTTLCIQGVTSSGRTFRIIPCLSLPASSSRKGTRSGFDIGREPRIFTGTAPSFNTKWQRGPAITRQTPSNTRGTSAMSDASSASFCASDGWNVGLEVMWLMRACGYLMWSMPSFL